MLVNFLFSIFHIANVSKAHPVPTIVLRVQTLQFFCKNYLKNMILSTLDERYFLKGEDKCQISELIQSMFISLKDACIHGQSYANKERDRENWRIESSSSTSKRGAVAAPGCLLGPVSFPFKSYDMDECPGDDSPYLVPPPTSLSSCCALTFSTSFTAERRRHPLDWKSPRYPVELAFTWQRSSASRASRESSGDRAESVSFESLRESNSPSSGRALDAHATTAGEKGRLEGEGEERG